MSFTATTTGREVPLILLVEDHQDTRQMYAEFLGIGYQVMTANDGEQALRAIRSHLPDLLITDLSLPRLDGFELMREVRRDPAIGRIPIICLSGHGGEAYEEQAREVGSDRLLLKPCMPDKLAEVAAELLRDAAKQRGNS
jgi:CheY-like chemotaxis protein